jgi:hypothetical protein
MSLFTRTGHVHKDALALRAVDDLPHQEAASIRLHLLSCSTCRNQLREMEDLVAALKNLARRSGPVQ